MAIQHDLCHSRARRAHHCCNGDNVSTNWSSTGLRLVCATPLNANANIWRCMNCCRCLVPWALRCACATPSYFGPHQLAHVVGSSACALLIVCCSCPWQSSIAVAVDCIQRTVCVDVLWRAMMKSMCIILPLSSLSLVSLQPTFLSLHPREVQC